MDTSTTGRIKNLIANLVQRSYLQYLAVFTATLVVAYLSLHYGTNFFRNVTDDTVRVWEQFGVAFGAALLVAAVLFFTRML